VKNVIKFAALALILFLAACGEDGGEDDPDDRVDTPVVTGPAWTAVTVTTFGSSDIRCVAWGNGKFLAGGDNGKLAYSADGISWTAVANTTFGSSTINCVAWGNGKFMAGGDSGKLAYSADGISWTAVANSTFSDYAINGLAWGNNKWVAVGRVWTAYSGADGTTWTGRNSNEFFSYLQGPPTLNAVAFNGSSFVLAGAAGGQGHGGSLATSPDGITWTPRSVEEVTSTAVNGLAFGGGKWAAVTLDVIMYSSNGTVWNAAGNTPPGKQFYGIAWGNGKFIAVGVSGTILYSADGITWTAFTDISLSSHFRGVAYGNGTAEGGTWLAVGLNGAMAYFIESTN
jgi:hypothetical protein